MINGVQMDYKRVSRQRRHPSDFTYNPQQLNLTRKTKLTLTDKI